MFTNDKAAGYNAVFKEAAHALEGEIIFVVSGTESGIQKRLAEFSLVEAAMTPTIRIMHPGQEMRKFVYQHAIEDITVSSIKTFVDDFNSDKIKPHLKSEAEQEQYGYLTTLVGTNYDAWVKDSTKDVFVMIYAPWCNHCMQLTPVWEELAQFVGDNDDLVIARFNAASNEVEGLRTPSFPSLRFYPRENKEGIEYTEPERDINAFKEWLAEHSSAFRA